MCKFKKCSFWKYTWWCENRFWNDGARKVFERIRATEDSSLLAVFLCTAAVRSRERGKWWQAVKHRSLRLCPLTSPLALAAKPERTDDCFNPCTCQVWTNSGATGEWIYIFCFKKRTVKVHTMIMAGNIKFNQPGIKQRSGQSVHNCVNAQLNPCTLPLLPPLFPLQVLPRRSACSLLWAAHVLQRFYSTGRFRQRAGCSPASRSHTGRLPDPGALAGCLPPQQTQRLCAQVSPPSCSAAGRHGLCQFFSLTGDFHGAVGCRQGQELCSRRGKSYLTET